MNQCHPPPYCFLEHTANPIHSPSASATRQPNQVHARTSLAPRCPRFFGLIRVSKIASFCL